MELLREVLYLSLCIEIGHYSEREKRASAELRKYFLRELQQSLVNDEKWLRIQQYITF
jgi:hypothetical protein